MKSIYQPHSKIVQNAFEVKYNCKDNIQKIGSSSFIHISLTLLIKSCPNPITINWIKHCQQTILPPVSIGSTEKVFDIMVAGIFNHNNKRFYSEKDKKNKMMVIPEEMNKIKLFLNNTSVEALKMKSPYIVFNKNNLDVIPTGWYNKGGYLTNKTSISLNFVCKPYKVSKNDIQLSLIFENYDPVNLFFEKDCNTIIAIQEHYTIIFMICWFILCILVVFIVLAIINFLNQTNSTLLELLKSIASFICCKYTNSNLNKNDDEDENRKLNTEKDEESRQNYFTIIDKTIKEGN